MVARNLLMTLLSLCLVFSMNRVALADAPYSFDRLWNSASWSINKPGGVAKDSNGNFYVASETDHLILKLSSAGKILAQWGSYGTGNGQFNIPKNVAVDSVGSFVYVADSQNNRIQKFDVNGTYLTQWNASDSPTLLTHPAGVALDSSGNVYVTEGGGSSRVLKFTSSGAYSATIGTGSQGSGNGQFRFPTGVALDSTGNIYVADYGNNRIQKLAADGTYQTQWNAANTGTLDSPIAVVVDSLNNVYVTDDTNFSTPTYRVLKYNSSGVYQSRILPGSGAFAFPNALAVDSSRNLYVADTNNNRITKYNSSGSYQSPDVTGNSITSINPSSVTVGVTGKYVYLTDIVNNSILKYSLDGTFQTTWGSAGIANGQFNISDGSGGVAVDASGNVYVADTGNNRIQKFDANGTFLAKWLIDGDTPGLNFQSPAGVAVDTSGNIYIADTNNARIVKLNSSGTYVTQWNTYDSNNNVDYITPIGVTVDTTGNVYVVYRDANLSIIQKFTSSGNYVAQWGGGASSADGQFSSPQGVAVDSAGYVYVADSGNSRIQKFAADGTFLAALGTLATTVPAPPSQFSLPSGVAVDQSGNIYVADPGQFRIQKFLPIPQSLTMSVTGNGGVASSPVGILTSTSQTSPFNLDTLVTLTASPVSGGVFQSWGGDCSSCTGTTCLVTMNFSKTCSASFSVVSYPLNVTISGNGNINSTNISPSGQTAFSCNTTGTCSPAYYVAGTVVTLSAISSAEFVFSNWTGCDSVSDNQCTVAISAPKNVTANFTYVMPAQLELTDGTPLGSYNTLTEAYASAPTDSASIIKTRVHNFLENILVLGNSTAVSIKGGYNETFTIQNGYSTFKGVFKINAGSLVVDHLVVQQP